MDREALCIIRSSVHPCARRPSSSATSEPVPNMSAKDGGSPSFSPSYWRAPCITRNKTFLIRILVTPRNHGSPRSPCNHHRKGLAYNNIGLRLLASGEHLCVYHRLGTVGAWMEVIAVHEGTFSERHLLSPEKPETARTWSVD